MGQGSVFAAGGAECRGDEGGTGATEEATVGGEAVGRSVHLISLSEMKREWRKIEFHFGKPVDF
jgi:hypothetical protein